MNELAESDERIDDPLLLTTGQSTMLCRRCVELRFRVP